MNKNDAIGILYPVQVTEEPLPVIEVGKYYLIDGECMECIRVHGKVYTFHGSSFSGWELDAKWEGDRKILLNAEPALSWEIKDMKSRRMDMLKRAASYFERFGTDNE